MEVSDPHRRIPVVESSQPSAARFAAQEAAEAAGFRSDGVYRAGLVATELATNLVKHATGGELLVRRAGEAAAPEIEIVAIDRGPGMADPGRALADGHSTAGSPGTGLGAVRRLSEEFDLYSQPDRGTVVVARLRAPRAGSAPRHRLLIVGGVSLARRGERVCGDAWQAHHLSDGTMVIMADGLGHGVQAREASAAAVAAADPRSDDLPRILETMHMDLRHTRGAAAALAAIRPRAQLVRFAGVGNVAAVVTRAGSARHAVSLNGTLGHVARAFREYTYPWHPDAALVIHTDGLGSRWSLDEYPGLRQRHPLVVAAVLYRDFARERDDVAVAVVREPV